MFAGLVALTACACGGGPKPSRTAYRGNVEAKPDLTILPSYPQKWEDLSSAMRFGWTLSEVSFAFDDPPKPVATTADPGALAAWSESEFSPWFNRKMDLVEHARFELSKAAEENRAERIMAAALISLLYEDISRTLRTLPVPESEAEARGSEKSYRLHAKAAYEACAKNASGQSLFAHWRSFCEKRGKRL